MKIIIFMIFIIAGSLNSCIQAPTSPSQVPIISMEKTLPILNERAKEWDRGANLWDIRISLDSPPEDRRSYELLSASYQSPSKNYETLLLSLMSSDSIFEEVFNYETPIIQSRPLTKDDWVYDSPEALKIFLENDQIQKDLREFELHALKLNRLGIWTLNIIKPDFKGSKYYSLDPKTNEIDEIIK
ncbi:MAG: hypothetical protein U9R58_02300 [Chloroflexota bacterium]|nr:hypothetical protein [Chloroflexota bacterium]